MNLTNNIPQKLFFDKLKTLIPQQETLVYILSDLLNLSIDAIYRRLRGQKELSFSEITLICQKFSISFDTFIGEESNLVMFGYTSLENDFNRNYKNYLNHLKNNLQSLTLRKNSKIIFAAMDIPMVRLVSYPELTAFKVHTWRKKNEFSDYGNLPFNVKNILDDEIINLYSEISEYYKRISSIEIWTANTIESTLKLIEYFNDIGDFKDKEILAKLFSQLEDMMKELKEIAIKGKSSNFLYKESFDLYLSDISLENNYIYTESDKFKAVYIKLYTINSISTQNNKFCNETKLWLDNLINKSTAISGSSQKQCYKFFNQIDKNINSTKERIGLL